MGPIQKRHVEYPKHGKESFKWAVLTELHKLNKPAHSTRVALYRVYERMVIGL